MVKPSIQIGLNNWATKKEGLLGYTEHDSGIFSPQDFILIRNSKKNVTGRTGLLETVTANFAGIDFKDNVNGALLLEPQSTNLFTYSEDFNAVSWGKGETLVSSNQIIAPDGTLSADKLIATSNSSTLHHVSDSITVPSTTETIFSVFAKKGEYDFLQLRLNSGSNDSAFFDLNLGIVGVKGANVTQTMVDYGNGWYKCSISKVMAGSYQFRVIVNQSNDFNAYIGDDVSGIYIWGAEVKQESYNTSYIKTTGAIATRLADTASKTGLGSYINSTEGVLYFSAKALANNLTFRFISLSDGTTANCVQVYWRTSSNQLVFAYIKNSVITSNITYTLSDITQLNKYAVKWKENDFALWINGVEVAVNSNGGVLTSSILNRLAFDNGSGSSVFYSETKDLRVYNTALTDLELQTLTTI